MELTYLTGKTSFKNTLLGYFMYVKETGGIRVYRKNKQNSWEISGFINNKNMDRIINK